MPFFCSTVSCVVMMSKSCCFASIWDAEPEEGLSRAEASLLAASAVPFFFLSPFF